MVGGRVKQKIEEEAFKGARNFCQAKVCARLGWLLFCMKLGQKPFIYLYYSDFDSVISFWFLSKSMLAYTTLIVKQLSIPNSRSNSFYQNLFWGIHPIFLRFLYTRILITSKADWARSAPTYFYAKSHITSSTSPSSNYQGHQHRLQVFWLWNKIVRAD